MLLATMLLGLLPPTLHEDEKATVFKVEECELSIDLSGLKLVRELATQEDGEIRGRWKGKLGAHRLEIEAHVYSNAEYWMREPADLMWLAEWHFTRMMKEAQGERTSTKDERWEFDREHYLPGPFGYSPYAMVGFKREEGEKPHHFICMGGVATSHSYTLEISTRKPLDDEDQKAVLEFLKTSIRYTGEVRVREWKDDEITERWKADGPEGLEKKLEFYRTDHFVILTNSSGKKKFGKELEKAYDKIQGVYPFEERKELRLLPIFLFRTPDQYYDFCVKTLDWSRDEAMDSKGVAYRDFYATWYEAPKDPVHIHEVTHQLFGNRLHLSGGGSWFQEGVAEYMSTTPNDRKEFRNLAKKAKHVPLRDFFKTRSLLGSNSEERVDGTDPASEAYLQAACLIEFVRESKQYKKKFQEFVHRVGAVPRSDLVRIEAAFREVLGVGIDEFEEQFLAYWKKR